jgi:hypothetical protein
MINCQCLWISALPSLSRGSAVTTIARRERRTNLRLREMTAGVISLFPIDINNDFCNSHVPAALRRSRFCLRVAAAIPIEPAVERLLPCQANRGGCMRRCSSCASSIGTHESFL